MEKWILIESIQHNACLEITGAIRGTSRENIYQELGLESLNFVVGTENLSIKNEHQKYFFDLITVRITPFATRTVGNTPLIKTKHNFFKNSFFQSAIIE